MEPFFIYIALINIVAGTLFAYDKFCAEHSHRRIPERVLHLGELLGGFPMIILLMYGLRHKCSKFAYYIWTYLIVLLWGVVLFFIFRNR